MKQGHNERHRRRCGHLRTSRITHHAAKYSVVLTAVRRGHSQAHDGDDVGHELGPRGPLGAVVVSVTRRASLSPLDGLDLADQVEAVDRGEQGCASRGGVVSCREEHGDDRG